MESPHVAAKRRVLIDALMMCLGKSRVVQVVDAQTVRGVIESASRDLWRQGEFRLDPVWKLLVSQPGLTAEDVAPPLLAFKAYENELGVVVRTPQALTAIPKGEQARLRDSLGIERADFERTLDELRKLAEAEASGENEPQPLGDVAAAAAQAQPARAARTSQANKTIKPAKPGKTPVPPAAIAAAVALVVVIIAASTWLALRDTSAGFDLHDVAGTLQLSNGKAAGGSLTATISDPRWESMSPDERKKAVSAVFDAEAARGIKAMTLFDDGGAARALVTETPNGRTIVLQ